MVLKLPQQQRQIQYYVHAAVLPDAFEDPFSRFLLCACLPKAVAELAQRSQLSTTCFVRKVLKWRSQVSTSCFGVQDFLKVARPERCARPPLEPRHLLFRARELCASTINERRLANLKKF